MWLHGKTRPALALCIAVSVFPAASWAAGPLAAATPGAVVVAGERATAEGAEPALPGPAGHASGHAEAAGSDSWTLLFVLLLATFVGLGVILRVSRLLHTPLMSLTNAISAIAVVGSILVAGTDYPLGIRILGAVALFASMTNIVSGFLITDRMLRMFKQDRQESQA